MSIGAFGRRVLGGMNNTSTASQRLLLGTVATAQSAATHLLSSAAFQPPGPVLPAMRLAMRKLIVMR